MPSSVAELFNAADVPLEDTARWGSRPGCKGPGVYAVAVSADSTSTVGLGAPPPISRTAVEELLNVRPELTVDGATPDVDLLAGRLSEFWAPDEPVLYIGLAGTSVSKRVGQYYRTPLGAKRPHAGGWFLKTLSVLPDLWVHYGPVNDTDKAENALLRAYCAGLSDDTRSTLRYPSHPFPFANLEWPAGTRKDHGIRGAREP